jgi:hypothetical protein
MNSREVTDLVEATGDLVLRRHPLVFRIPNGQQLDTQVLKASYIAYCMQHYQEQVVQDFLYGVVIMDES